MLLNTNSKGIYSLYTKEELEHLINILVFEGFLAKRKYDGTYGVFYTLKTTNKCKFLNYQMNYTLTSINKKIKANKMLNDDEILKYIENLSKKESVDLKTYITCLDFIKNKSYISNHKDEYIKFMKTAPEELMTLLKMKKQTENNKYFIKIYQEIIK